MAWRGFQDPSSKGALRGGVTIDDRNELDRGFAKRDDPVRRAPTRVMPARDRVEAVPSLDDGPGGREVVDRYQDVIDCERHHLTLSGLSSADITSPAVNRMSPPGCPLEMAIRRQALKAPVPEEFLDVRGERFRLLERSEVTAVRVHRPAFNSEDLFRDRARRADDFVREFDVGRRYLDALVGPR